MLSENNAVLRQCRNQFSEQVSDVFGASVCETVFDAAISCVSSMEAAEEEAETKQSAIQILLAELRAII